MRITIRPSIFAFLAVAAVFLVGHSPAVRAGIVSIGDVDPGDPSTWTDSTDAYVGKTSSGSVVVDGGSEIFSEIGTVGYSSGSCGSVTVSGPGSTWTNSTWFTIGDLAGSKGEVSIVGPAHLSSLWMP